MKIAIAFLAMTMALNVSAKSLNCTAQLSSKEEDNKKFFASLDWMEANNIKFDNETLIPEEFRAKPVAVSTREVKLDNEENAEISASIIDDYEKHGISYNFSVYVEKGNIIYVRAENEVTHGAFGVSNLKNQTEVEFGASSLEDGSALDIKCEIK